MIWLDSQGMVPAGSQVGTFGSYQVWYCQMSWNYICYYQTGKNSVSVNLKDFINDAVSRGYLESSWYLHDIEAGFEICSGGEGLTVNSFSVSVSGNGGDVPTSTTESSSSISSKVSTPTPQPYSPTFSITSVIFGLALIGLIGIYRKLERIE